MPEQFWSLTPREYVLMCQGYDDKCRREWKIKQHELYLLRFIGATLHNIGAMLSKGASAIKPKDLMRLPDIDTGSETEAEPDPERFAEIVKRDGKKLPDGFPSRRTKSDT